MRRWTPVDSYVQLHDTPENAGYHYSNEPGAHWNKVFHRCYHRAAGIVDDTALDKQLEHWGGSKLAGRTTGARVCQCQCAQWVPTAWSQPNCPRSGNRVTVTRSMDCKFGRNFMKNKKCLAGDKPTTGFETEQENANNKGYTQTKTVTCP